MILGPFPAFIYVTQYSLRPASPLYDVIGSWTGDMMRSRRRPVLSFHRRLSHFDCASTRKVAVQGCR